MQHSAITSHTAIPVSSDTITTLTLATQTIPTGATHVIVKTANSNGEMATGVSTRILDRVANDVLVLPHLGSEASWLGTGVGAVICRVAVAHVNLGLGYVNDQAEINADGTSTGVVPLAQRQSVQYPYFASQDTLLALGTTVTGTVTFDKAKQISCVQMS